MNRIDVLKALKLKNYEMDEIMLLVIKKVGKGKSICYSEDNYQKIKNLIDAKKQLKIAREEVRNMELTTLEKCKKFRLEDE